MYHLTKHTFSKFKTIGILFFVGIGYLLAGKMQFFFGCVQPGAFVLWVPAGIALASLLIFGIRFWPIIFVAAFLININAVHSIPAAFGIALGNTLEATIATYLVNKFAHGKNAFLRAQDIFRYALLAAILSTTISANIGVVSMILSGYSLWSEFFQTWLMWWMGDATAILIIAPFFIFWSARHPLYSSRKNTLEAIILFVLLLLISIFLFGNIIQDYPLEYLCMPIIIWIAFRFGRRETISALLLITIIATWGTLQGFGPFVRATTDGSILFLQIFMNVLTITALGLAVAVAQRRDENVKNAALLESIGDGILATDQDGKIILVNKVFEELLGWKEEEVLGERESMIFDVLDDKEKTLSNKNRPVSRALEEKKKITATFFLKRKDGTQFPARIIATPIILNDKLVGAVTIFHDITKEKQVDEMKTEFISLASHELRTPLSAIKGFISMINDGDYGQTGSKLARPLHIIQLSTERLIHIVNEMLDVSRIESGKLQLNITDFTVAELIKESIADMQPLAKKRGLNIKVIKGLALEVSTDNEKVIAIMHNLIGNAIKFTQKGTITISYEQKGDFAIIAVQDTGLGVAKEHQGQLFSKFDEIKLKQAGKTMGTGLGLYISREFAKKMHGDVWLEYSEMGIGSIFAFSLPLKGTSAAIELKKISVPESELVTDIL